ncbi:DUF4142 domain-containing protein [Methylobacterium gnaphalii]|uniref:DUF4142 domain-containing protein n=1 Tax=Methylobacterium gnaphalii TaxID=1010610 RepID=A0A512JGL1_9HYPH|nr:DUF4142 domain-containing protein [Methylobacterium gnaphalii]GEP09098.1 hypothetical protein MGN01_09430 [Methylobacterium gnaphalii]GJD68411.1 hypothetical protein MMMDOFMJ_1334 [Methylobacterium gnaphalii]GLS49022.1 hypothetical protein GCM10007885_18690 [Methylobacterium gnaphalii]
MKQALAPVALGLSVVLAGSALAQEPLPVRIAPSEVTLPVGATTNTGTFRAEALRSDAASIEASRLALQRSRNRDVRDYARRVIETRKATTEALLPPDTSLTASGLIAYDARSSEAAPNNPSGIVLAPVAVTTPIVEGAPVELGPRVALGPKAQARIDQLRAAPDAGSFDQAYVAQQARADARALALYEGYSRSGDSIEGRRFANEALPYIAAEHDRSSHIDLSLGS